MVTARKTWMAGTKPGHDEERVISSQPRVSSLFQLLSHFVVI
jgi:hypothetical protein